MPVKNISLGERKVRMALGSILILLSILLFFSNQIYPAVALFAIGLIPFVTSVTGTCPFYCAMKRSTNKQ